MRIFYALVVLLLAGYANTFSQTVKITGQVKTKKDSALADATISIKGADNSVVADNNRAFLTTNNHAKVVVYPNPSQGRIQIKTNEVIKELYLTDFTGKMLEKSDAGFKTQVWQIDLSKYPSGTYLIRYFTEQKRWGTTKVSLMK